MIDTVPPAMEVAPDTASLPLVPLAATSTMKLLPGLKPRLPLTDSVPSWLLPGQIVPNTAVVGSTPVPRTVPAGPTVRPLEETSEPLASSVPPETVVEPV